MIKILIYNAVRTILWIWILFIVIPIILNPSIFYHSICNIFKRHDFWFYREVFLMFLPISISAYFFILKQKGPVDFYFCHFAITMLTVFLFNVIMFKLGGKGADKPDRYFNELYYKVPIFELLILIMFNLKKH